MVYWKCRGEHHVKNDYLNTKPYTQNLYKIKLGEDENFFNLVNCQCLMESADIDTVSPSN